MLLVTAATNAPELVTADVVVTVYVMVASRRERRKRRLTPLMVMAEVGTLAAAAMVCLKVVCIATLPRKVDAETPTSVCWTLAVTKVTPTLVGAVVGALVVVKSLKLKSTRVALP